MNRCSTMALLIPLLAVGACASSGGTNTAAAVPSNDLQFVQTAYQANMTEELAASYAASKAQSPAVKAFASRMMADHDNMAIGVKQLAMAQGMTMPTSPTDAQLSAISAISSNNGAAFDKAYLDAEIARHKTLLQAYQTEAASGSIAAIKQYASDRLPVVQSHLSSAESLLPQG